MADKSKHPDQYWARWSQGKITGGFDECDNSLSVAKNKHLWWTNSTAALKGIRLIALKPLQLVSLTRPILKRFVPLCHLATRIYKYVYFPS